MKHTLIGQELTLVKGEGMMTLPQVGRVIAASPVGVEESPHSMEHGAG